jgi:multidrug efflux system membrane fusion protein
MFAWISTRGRDIAGAPWRGARTMLRSFRFWVLCFVFCIVLLVVYYALADTYAPLTTDAYVQAYVIQVAPRVEGQVVRVHVKDNDVVRQGQLLFEVDPRPFEHRVATLEAKLAWAVQQVAQLESDLKAAQAEHDKLEAEANFARTVRNQDDEIFKKKSTTERTFLNSVQKHAAAEAAVRRSAELVKKAQQALAARIGEEHALVAEVKAQLAAAKLDLEYTRTYAPADGYVTNLQLREGAYAHTGQAVLTCIDTSQWLIVCNFRESCLKRLESGQPAWISFKTYPTTIYTAKVHNVGWGVSQGQGMPSGQLPDIRKITGWVPAAQRFQVRLQMDDPDTAPLRVGMTCTASVYPVHDSPLTPLTKLLHRVLSWFDYID